MRLARGGLTFLAAGIWASAQVPDAASSSYFDLPRIKSFSTHRESSGNRYTGSNDDSKRIMPGETLVMADLQGPGVVTHIWLTVADNEYAWPRLLRLRVYYDGKKTPSVDAPLGDFFGVGHGYERNLDSMLVRDSSFGRARNSYWPMPFRERCRITVTDEGNRPVTMFYYHVDWRKEASLPDEMGYFHAYYRQERPAVAGRHYEFLSIKGTGHYVGTVLNVIQAQAGWFGEGDDLFYVDGAPHPQIVGTGTEDYVNDAWDLRVSCGSWVGTPVAEGVGLAARLTGYRWHVPDPIAFTKSLWAGIEHAGWTYDADGTLRSGFEERPDYFSSTAFWYQKGVNEGLAEPPYGEDRLPIGNAQQIAVEDFLAEVTTEKGKASVQREVDWGKDLLYFEAEGAGSRINIPLDIPESGRYEIVARIAQAPDYGDYTALLDGKPTNPDNRKAATSEPPSTGPQVFRNYLPEVYVAVDRPLGWLSLEKGRHTLTFICTGKDSHSAGHNFGINDVVLQRIREETVSPANIPPQDATASHAAGPVYRGFALSAYVCELGRASGARRAGVIRAIGAFGEDAAPAVHELAGALGDADAGVRAAAAWALSQMGAAAAPAVPALQKSLADANPRVRSLSAVALKAIGPRAAAAVPALINALRDEAAYVRAPAAAALGKIGPAAKASVQALSERLLAPGEPAFVLRNVAGALGEIGPDASGAIPALREALKMHRVTYAAQEAILRINRQPVPTW